MKNLLTNISKSKKRALMGVACGALLLTLGAGSALAGDEMPIQIEGEPIKNIHFTTCNVALEGDSLLVQMEDGQTRHSTDGGETWIDGVPAGTVTKAGFGEGMPHMLDGDAIPKGAIGIAVKNTDGKMQFSTDGGETWTDEAPTGMEVDENGAVATFLGPVD